MNSLISNQLESEEQFEEQLIYKENIIDHYKFPRNKGTLEFATHTAKEFNSLCGDHVIIHLNVSEGIIQEVSFEGDGCAISQASTSILTEHLKGKNVEDVKKMIPCDVHTLLKIPISHARKKCAFLSLKAVQGALK